ncbi:MAG: HAMP domain-containing histidine kinase, partial [bacterium]|nr:HAMP domain-containing histidine kinase [Candidatus Colisoma equi]
GLNGFFDTCGEPYPADVPCIFEVARTDNFFVGVGRPSFQMLLPFLGALLVIVLAALVGIAGVLLFFFVTHRQRVRIRELAKLERFRREFIADVSHEIKTPLTGILGAVDMMGDEVEKRGGGGQRNVLLDLIKKESKRLNGLVQSILDLARLEREGDVLNLQETDPGELVREIAAKYPCVCTVKSSGVVRCDPQLLEQAVSNLIGNAVRQSGSQEISVKVEREGRTARITVEDHGIGIPPEHAAQVFERFHRVDPARAAETGGAGLGLAIARRIARLHGGDLVLFPVKPHGCRFVLSLTIR